VLKPKILQKAVDLSVDWLLRNGYPRIASRAALMGGRTRSGTNVNEVTALACSTVWACKGVISESIGMLPVHLMQGTELEAERAERHPLWKLIHDKVNDEMTAQTFRETLQAHACIWGNGYAQIIRRSGSGEAIAFDLWTPESVRRDKTKAGKPIYIRKDGNSQDKEYQPRDVFHLRGPSYDGQVGYSLAQLAAESIGIAMSAELYAAMFFGNGGRVPGYLNFAGKFRNQQEFDEFRARNDATYSGEDSWHKMPIYESGMEWKPFGVKPQEMQFMELRAWMVSEICRWFRVQPHLVADLSRSTNNNIEHQGLEFRTFTLNPWIGRWNGEYLLKVLPADGGLFTRFDDSAITQADFQTRMSGYATLLQNGVICVDEARAGIGMNPLDGGAGKDHHIQLNMQTLPGGTPTAGQQAALFKLQPKQEPTPNAAQ